MSVAELIEKIKALSPEEFQAVREFILNGSEEGADPKRIQYIPDDEFEAAADWVFREHAELLRKLAE